MPSNTPNFNFEYPLSSDPLADGAQSIQDFATTADTTFADLLGGTTGQYLAKNSNTNMDFVWSNFPADPVGFISPQGAGYYIRSFQYTTFNRIENHAGTTNNHMYLVPIIFGQATTIDRIGVRVTNAQASSTVRLGMYNSNTNGEPSTRIFDAGTVSSATTGVKEITISQSITAGLKWIAIVPNTIAVGLAGVEIGNGSTVRYYLNNPFVQTTSSTNAFGGAGGATSPTNYYRTGVTGALPDPAGATAQFGVIDQSFLAAVRVV